MNMTDNQLATDTAARDVPDVPRLVTAMQTALTDSRNFCGRMETNDRIKNCWWQGQSEDGRKHAEDLDEDPRPWEGSSDQRIRLARMLVKEEKLLCTAALAGGRMQAVGVDSLNDPVAAAAQAPMLRWLFAGPMRREMRDELDWLLDWRATFGHAVLRVEWHTRRALRREILTRDDLLGLAVNAGLTAAGLPTAGALGEASAAGQIPPEMAETAGVVAQQTEQELVSLLLDPDRTAHLRGLVGALLNADPDDRVHVSAAEIRRLVTKLQRGDPGEYYRPAIVENRPRWRALLPWVDVFYPASTTDLQHAQWVAQVHWLTETALRDQAVIEGWSETWLEEVMKHKGRGSGLDMGSRTWLLGGSGVRRGSLQAEEEQDGMFQIIELHQMSSVDGVPALFRTVLHVDVVGEPAIHHLVEDGYCMPYFAFRREREGSRYLLESEGVPELVQTNQMALKAQHDARTNRTDLELLPPISVPANRMAEEFVLGPMAQIPVRRSGTMEWMKPPPVSMDTVAVAAEEWANVDRLFGRFSESVPPALVQLHQGAIATDFLTDVSAVCQATWDLCLYYFSEDEWQSITGEPRPDLDIYHRDMMIVFDVRNLDIEWLRSLAELYTAFVLPSDSDGVVDRAEFVSYLAGAINPQLAARIVRPRDAAEQSEIEDELTQLAVMMAGEEPVQKQGQNYALRLQVLERAASRSAEVQRKLAENEQIRAVFEARVKFFRDQLQQAQNAIIGRTMQQPVMNAPK